MFNQNHTLFLQKKPAIKKLGKLYHILTDDQLLGTVEEAKETVYNLGNQLLSLISLFNIVSIQLNVLDSRSNLLGTIQKKKGYYNDFYCYDQNKEPLTVIKSNIKMNSSKITVYDMNGEELATATSGFGATDFVIKNNQTTETISSIKRRSKVYDTVKENFLYDDGYYIDNRDLDDRMTLSLIAIGIILDMYYFNS